MSAATRRGERGPVARQEETGEAGSGAPDWTTVDGAGLLRALHAGTDWLERNSAGVNALNVFPVPDGDTGTNMFLTMQAAYAAAAEGDEGDGRSVGDVASRAAHGALMGARGNSGVILSQIFRGMATALDGQMTLDGALLAAAFTEASAMAYKAVLKPVEGTLLTVSRGAAEAAERVAKEGGDVQAVLDGALAGGRATLAKTPEMLPLLREAGVVDAGGQGYVIILEGMRLHLAGRNVAAEAVPTIAPSDRAMAFDVVGMHARHGADEYGYCTNYLLTAAPGASLDFAVIRETMAAMGHSAVIVGDAQYIKAHIHTTDPGALLSYAVRFGALTQIKIENMNMQVEDIERSAPLNAPYVESTSHISVVAVAAGEGLSAVLRGLGAAKIVRGGPTMNPSTQELLDAITSAPSGTVIVLPNNSNVVLTARQAAAMASKQVRVVPTTSIPQGIAALSAFTFTADLDTNAAAMTEMARTVRTGEVTRAVRDATIGGVAVKAGEVIGLLDDLLTVAGDDSVTVTLDLLQRMHTNEAELVTLYTGADVSDTIAEALSARIAERYANVAVEIVTGGQPHYDFIVSVE
ncbi:MAG: DAK2 domain-containing protein [Chloroflexota bacterium]|nr:DAK2 domain-containing protein [Chloroflexota bacterium]